MSRDEDFNSVYMAIRGRLARVVSRIVPPKEIEDIVQETYVRMCQVKDKERISAPHSFMMKTARNLALDHVKRAESRLAVSVEEDPESGWGEGEGAADETFERVASGEDFAHFCEAVRELPTQCRRVFVLKKVYGYSQREIAEELNLSESTIEKHIATGIKRCAYYMAQRADDEGKSGRSPTVSSSSGGRS